MPTCVHSTVPVQQASPAAKHGLTALKHAPVHPPSPGVRGCAGALGAPLPRGGAGARGGRRERHGHPAQRGHRRVPVLDAERRRRRGAGPVRRMADAWVARSAHAGPAAAELLSGLRVALDQEQRGMEASCAQGYSYHMLFMPWSTGCCPLHGCLAYNRVGLGSSRKVTACRD